MTSSPPKWSCVISLLRLTHPLILPLVAPPIRDAVTSLWALDARLAELARAGREPALRQIRLAWWSEQLAKLDPLAAPAEPMLQSVAAHLLAHVDGAALATLADAWVAEALEEADGAERGAVLFALTARLLGQGDADALALAGRGWAMVERGLAEGATVWTPDTFDGLRLSALLRPLAAVTAVARRIARHDGARSPGREQGVVFRVGLLGR